MPVRPLPSKPSLDHLKYQAKDLITGHAANDPGVAQRIREFHPRWGKASDAEIFGAPLALSDAQLTIAREYGFASWVRLKRRVEKPTAADQVQLPHHERIEDAVFRRAVDLLDAGDAAGLRKHLEKHPKLVAQRVVFEGGNYFRNPALLEFAAENPVRRGSLPTNVVEMARIILDAGADAAAIDATLGLVCSGRVARESGVQIPLIDLLCDSGADASGALPAALVHGEFEAAHALIRRGAAIDLPAAAALGRTGQVKELIPASSAEDRHRALALAAQFGHAEVVRLLLDGGEDPNRYNPVGLHSHSTPLHQAALSGHGEVVRLLVERGARIDLLDTMWHGTAADWARHGGQHGIAEYLDGLGTGSPG